MSNSPRSRKSSDAKGNSSQSKKPKSTVDPIPTSESEEKTGVDTSPSLSSEPPLVVEEPVAEKLPIEEPIILEEPVVKTPEPEPVAIVETPVVEETPEPEPVAIVETPVVEETPEPEPVAIVETPVVEETPEPEPVAIVETPVVEEEPTPEPIVEQTIAEEPPLVEEKPAVVVEEPTPEPLVEDQPKWVNTLATEILFNAEPTSASKVEVVIDSPTTFSYDSVNQSVQPMKEEIIAFLSELPENLGSFFKDYKRPLTTVGLIVAFLITFKILVGLVEIINEIPLIKPTFETVGLGYSAWFIYRYLLKADNRKEISADFNTLKEEILGKKS
ncbi:CAAD domain-containing protein [Planktothrix agardhii]|jgi:glutamyl-tRNA synthetase|uniref:CAAD domain-containing protein n=1 Tax=Planktothrix agardhii TaxID=1160 RepID=UPI0020A7F584|nr:CAAD domain-containing protein [Planktothrix agardhii]CAD5918137.1 Glutamate--tRNA ligase [Planktothrix agardhii]